MTLALSPRTLRDRRRPAALLSRNTELLSLDTFGLALQPTFLDDGHKHDLVSAIVGRQVPAIASDYPRLRTRAEKKARAVAASQDQDEVALSSIYDHLHELLLDRTEGHEASTIARLAIDTELDLGRMLGRPNPDALELHRQARQRGIATAVIADSSLPRDLVDHIIRASGFVPDFVIVSSNEGQRKGSGLYQRLLGKTGVAPHAVVHFGPDEHLDVEVPRQYGIVGHRSPDPASSPGTDLLMGFSRPSGLDSLLLSMAAQHHSRPTITDGEGFGLGYYAAGPMAVGFCRWLGASIERAEPDHVILCGHAGELIDRVLSIVCPRLPAETRHVLPVNHDGSCPVERLATTVPLRSAKRVLVAGLGLFEQPHRRAADVLAPQGRGPVVTGAYLGLPHAPDRSADVWAFDDAADCPIRAAAYRRPEVLEAMLRFLPRAAQDVSPLLRPFHAVGRSMSAGALTFAEDVEPWLHLDPSGPTPATLEPALRVIIDPAPAEAHILAPYPVYDRPDAGSDQPLACLPNRSVAALRPSVMAGEAERSPWPAGYQALVRHRSSRLRVRPRRSRMGDGN